MPYFGVVLKSLVWLHPGVRDPHIKKVRDAQRLAQGYESRTVVSPWACSHGCGRPRAGEVSRPGGVTNLSALQRMFPYLKPPSPYSRTLA